MTGNKRTHTAETDKDGRIILTLEESDPKAPSSESTEEMGQRYAELNEAGDSGHLSKPDEWAVNELGRIADVLDAAVADLGQLRRAVEDARDEPETPAPQKGPDHAETGMDKLFPSAEKAR